MDFDGIAICPEVSDRGSYMKGLLAKYEHIRGKHIQEVKPAVAFWDIVVLTAVDAEQSHAYEEQLNQKRCRKELPEGVVYHVITDPQGPKIGNGGSTLEVLNVLERLHGSALYTSRILLLHAGGQSQRMPSSSVLGKIFMSLPIGNRSYQVLDLKLANYIPFVRKMQAGVFLVSADDILLFDLSNAEDDFDFNEEGFIPLAHPSPLNIGQGHGVYVIKGSSKDSKKKVELVECVEVLQKPSIERMHARGAVLTNCVHSSSSGKEEHELVYTDSVFYFDTFVMKKLLQFYKSNAPLNCEIDAYGDFLQALGNRASIDYVKNTCNVSTVTEDLIDMREKIFHLLKGTPIHVLTLNNSTYIHVGTMKEYLYHFCNDKRLVTELGFSRDVFNHWTTFSEKCPKVLPQVKGCVMHSVLPSQSVISANSVVEYCRFDVPLYVNGESVISNCEYLSDKNPTLDISKLDIPEGVFLHSFPIVMEISGSDSKTGYITVVFHIRDDLKKRCTGTSDHGIMELPYLGTTLGEAVSKLGLTIQEVYPDYLSASCSLWFVKLFPIVQTMTESLCLALKMLSAVQSSETNNKTNLLADFDCLSVAEALGKKNVSAMLTYRNQVYDVILQHH